MAEETKIRLLVMAEKERVDRQKEALLARRRAAIADLVAPRAEVPAAAVAEEPSRQLWDTGPIRELARNAAVRTVRTVRRRPADRVPV